MNKHIYFFPISIEPLKKRGFLAICQTLQGCRAEGKSYGEAIENIQDVIKIHIEARKKFNDPLPEVSIPETTNVRLSLPLPVSL